MKNPVSMHMLNSLQDLINLRLDFLFWDVILPSINSVIEITVHKLKN